MKHRLTHIMLGLIQCACLLLGACRCKEDRNFTIINGSSRELDVLFIPPPLVCGPSVVGPTVVYRARVPAGGLFAVKDATPTQMKEQSSHYGCSFLFARAPSEEQLVGLSLWWWSKSGDFAHEVVLLDPEDKVSPGIGIATAGTYRNCEVLDLEQRNYCEFYGRFWPQFCPPTADQDPLWPG